MKRTRIFDFEKYRFYRELKGNSLFFVFLFLFFGSFLIGTAFVSKSNSGFYLDYFFDFFINAHTNASFFKSFLNIFLFSYAFLIFISASGLWVLGTVFVPAAVFFRGILLGMILGKIYSQFMITGVVFNILALALPLTVSILLLLEISVNAMNYSYFFLKCFTGNKYFESTGNSRTYILGILYVTLISGVIALIEATVSGLFLNYFSLG